MEPDGARNDLALDKQRLRKQLMARRKQMTQPTRQVAEQQIHVILEAILQQVHVTCISGYVPIGTEVNVMPTLQRMHEQGVTCALPIVEQPDAPLCFREWTPQLHMVPGPMNIPQPPDSARRVTPDLFLVPLLGFDRHGYRVGYGGGFYDRSLAEARAQRKVRAIGVAFGCQEVVTIPRNQFDMALDWIATETEAIGPFAGE